MNIKPLAVRGRHPSGAQGKERPLVRGRIRGWSPPRPDRLASDRSKPGVPGSVPSDPDRSGADPADRFCPSTSRGQTRRPAGRLRHGSDPGRVAPARPGTIPPTGLRRAGPYAPPVLALPSLRGSDPASPDDPEPTRPTDPARRRRPAEPPVRGPVRPMIVGRDGPGAEGRRAGDNTREWRSDLRPCGFPRCRRCPRSYPPSGERDAARRRVRLGDPMVVR